MQLKQGKTRSTWLWWPEGMVLLGPTGHLHKATPSRPEAIADLRNIQKQTQKMKQRNTFRMKEQKETSEKELNEMEISNLPYVESNGHKDAHLNSGEKWMNTVRTLKKRI